MQCFSDTNFLPARLRHGVAVWLLALLACSPVAGQQPYRLAARQPSYPSAATRKQAADSASTSTFNKVKQKLSSLPKLFHRDSANNSNNNKNKARPQRKTSPTSTRGFNRRASSTSRRNPFDAIRKTFGKVLPGKPTRRKRHLRHDVTRGQQTTSLRPPLSKRGGSPGQDVHGSRPLDASSPQTSLPILQSPTERRKPYPPIVFGSSKRLPTAKTAAKSPPQRLAVRSNARPIPLPVDAAPPTIKQPHRQPQPIEWASDVEDAPPLPLPEPLSVAPPAIKQPHRQPIEWASGVEDAPPLPLPPPLPLAPPLPDAPLVKENDADRPSPRTIDVPLSDTALDGRINISSRNGRISLIVRDAPLESVLNLVAQQQGLNIVTAGSAAPSVSATLTNVNLDDALNSILAIAGYTWTRQKDIILVSPVTANSGVAPSAQGRRVRVFPLNFVAATDVQQIVTGLLSPIGQVFITEADPADKRRTRDLLVVEDLPDYVRRVEEYVAQVDRPPRQVLIEAHILRVDLSDDTRHGVDFQYIAQLTNTDLTLRTQGFANAAASPAFFLGIDATDVTAFVEAIKTTNDAKTLASPKVLVVNGQDARIQIGERFGFLVTTTTQTSTLQNVNFLDVGVVMTVTPQISDDGQVLMNIRPEVSSGRINTNTGLPEEETTEVSTTVMLPDGHGIVIGGLIQESDTTQQTKIPIVGDLWLFGKLFQRNTIVRKRSEIIIALIPRIVPYGTDYDIRSETEFTRATTPVLDGALWQTDRPWEPVMPDAGRNPRRIRVGRIPDIIPNLFDPAPLPVEYYFATQPEFESWIPPLLSRDDDDLVEYESPRGGPPPVPSHPYNE